MNGHSDEYFRLIEKLCEHKDRDIEDGIVYCTDCGKDLTEEYEAKYDDAKEQEATGN